MHEFRAAIIATIPDAAPPDHIEPGKLHRFSTNGRRGDDAGWCRLFPDTRAGVFGCHRHQIRETWITRDREGMTPTERAALARQIMAATTERQTEQAQRWRDAADRLHRLAAELVPVTRGDPVARYMRRRGIDAWPLPDCLRLHPNLPYWHDGAELGRFRAMLCPITAPDGRLIAWHRTYLTEDGRKASVPTPKKLTAAAGPLAGACIPLGRPAHGVLGIAEGVETALAASLASGVPSVAAYCAGNLAAYRWPAGLRRLLVFADADRAGREAADTLRRRAMAEGVRVDVLTPSTEGIDWADVVASRVPMEAFA